jgi:hypothetical protein
MKILYIGVSSPSNQWHRHHTTILKSIQILRNESKPAVELCAERDLSSYSRFTRTSVGEFMSLFSKTVAERTRPGQRQDVEEQSYTFHAYARSEGVAGIIISDQEYPALVAHQLLGKILDEFLGKYPRSAFSENVPAAGLAFPELKDYIVKYQDPQQADSIMKVCLRCCDHDRGGRANPAESSRADMGPYADTKRARRDQDRAPQDHRVGLGARREDRQPGSEIRRAERTEQDVLYPGQKAELVLRDHVDVECYGNDEM